MIITYLPIYDYKKVIRYCFIDYDGYVIINFRYKRHNKKKQHIVIDYNDLTKRHDFETIQEFISKEKPILVENDKLIGFVFFNTDNNKLVICNELDNLKKLRYNIITSIMKKYLRKYKMSTFL